MKNFFKSFYTKLSVIFLLLLLILGATQIFITMQSSMRFIDEADQRLNLPLAQNMANELRPFLSDSLSLSQIEDKIHYMMVMNPEVEIYLLNSYGKILAFFAEPRKKVQKEFVMVIGSNADDVKEEDLFAMAVAMESHLNIHFPKYRVHISEKEQA